MRKIRKIQVLENFIIRCEFDNGEVRDLDITSIIDKNGKIAVTIVGSRKKEDFVKIINKYLN